MQHHHTGQTETCALETVPCKTLRSQWGTSLWLPWALLGQAAHPHFLRALQICHLLVLSWRKQTFPAGTEWKWKSLLLSICFYFLFLLAYIKLLMDVHREVSIHPQVTRKISSPGPTQRPPNNSTIPNELLHQVPDKSVTEPNTKLSVVSTEANVSTVW